jgi:hypothetical protein
MRTPRNLPPPDFDVPPVPLSVILRCRHRRHRRGMALGYLIGVVMILVAFFTHNGIVLTFGVGFALATWDLGQRACRKQGCRMFSRRQR